MAHQTMLGGLKSGLGAAPPRAAPAMTGRAPRPRQVHSAGPRQQLGQACVARPPRPDSSIRNLLCGARDGGAGDASQADTAYEAALELSRQQQYGDARAAFEDLLRAHPTLCKAWVSYAQMEKRVGRLGDPQRFDVARYILQRGLSVNPGSACLAQAWGLLELQRGNWWAAVRLLERCVSMDASNAPVLRWQPVQSARKTVSGRPRRGGAAGVATAAAGAPPRRASVVPAAGGGGAAGAGGGAGAGGAAGSS